MEYAFPFPMRGHGLNKNDFCCRVVATAFHYILGSIYDITYENTELLRPFADKGFVLFPKHQSWLDIPLEAVLLQNTIGKYAYYFMRDNVPLSSLLGPLGGIKVTRYQELKKRMRNADERNKMRLLNEAKERREHMNNTIPYILENGGVVVLHPEGERNFKKEVEIPPANLQRFLDAQKQLGYPITFFPLDFDYAGRKGFQIRPSITVSVRNPIQAPDDGLDQLIEHLVKEVTYFTNPKTQHPTWM